MKPKYKFNKEIETTICNHCNKELSKEKTNDLLCNKCLEDLVYNYKTINKYGFIQEEIEELIKMFPNFNEEKYVDAMRGNTCMMTVYNGKPRIVNYHCDVLTGLKCGIENRNIRIEEWD